MNGHKDFKKEEKKKQSHFWWWQTTMMQGTLTTTERHESPCSYQSGNCRGVHWSVSCRHQHRLQNNRRDDCVWHKDELKGTAECAALVTLQLPNMSRAFIKTNAVFRCKCPPLHSGSSCSKFTLCLILLTTALQCFHTCLPLEKFYSGTKASRWMSECLGSCAPVQHLRRDLMLMLIFTGTISAPLLTDRLWRFSKVGKK